MPERDDRAHWEAVWGRLGEDQVSWYQPRPDVSLALVRRAGLPPSAGILDVGGGASRLVDLLLADGHDAVTVLDIAEPALARARARLGAEAARVRWVTADVTAWTPDRPYLLWHDRALFHFLGDARDRAAYLRVMGAAVAPTGQVIIGAFAPDGPERCSGLPVVRYDAAALAAALGSGWRLVEEVAEGHATPKGTLQRFQFGRFARA
jgi:SAM-dependent methyltransferase